MSRSANIIDRVIIGALGLALIGGGLAAYLTGTAPDLPESLPVTPATWVLVLIAALAILIAIWLIAANLRRDRPDPVVDASSDATGTLTYRPAVIADAVAEQLAEVPGVRRATARAEVLSDTPTLTIRGDIRRSADAAPVTAACRRLEADVRAGADPDIAVRFLLHVDADG